MDQDGNPVEGVTIKLYCERAASGFEVTTDAKGKWRAFYIRGGPYDMDFEKAGFMPKHISRTISEYNKNPDKEIKSMKKSKFLGKKRTNFFKNMFISSPGIGRLFRAKNA